MKTTSRKTGRKIWAVWDCPFCDSKGIHGSLRECPNCGRPRSTSTEFKEGNTKEYLTEEEVQTHQNPDWLCECCDSYNSDTLQVCESCGAPRGASKDYFEVREKENKQEVENAASKWFTEMDSPLSYNTPVDSPNRKPPSKRKFFKSGRSNKLFTGIFAILAVLLLVGFGIKLLTPKPVSFTVESKSWSYSIEIEELQTIKEDGWSPPSDARIINKEWKVKEYNKEILDHYETVEKEVTKSKEVWDHDDVTYTYEDDGNGALDEIEHRTPAYRTEYYTEVEKTQEPVYRYEDVYDWYYYYEYDRWRTTRRVTTLGSETTEPYWGEAILGSKEREGTRSSNFEVVGYTDDGESCSFTLSEGYWRQLNVGDAVKATKRFNTIVEILEINGVELKK